MTAKIVPASRLTDWRIYGHVHAKGVHKFKARLVGPRIIVEDEQGRSVTVNFSATQDMRTCYAHVESVGFIGGWTYPHRKMPWTYLAESINRGVLYHDINDLPKRAVLKKCPHCGKEL